MSLMAAATRFGVLNRKPPEPVSPDLEDGSYTPLTAAVRTDDERLCRQVINWVERLLRDEAPDQVDAVLRRLDAEYRAEQEKHGTVRLPDPSTILTTDAPPDRS
jgi:hypothetical protein